MKNKSCKKREKKSFKESKVYPATFREVPLIQPSLIHKNYFTRIKLKLTKKLYSFQMTNFF